MSRHRVDIEGLSPEEILAFTESDLQDLVLCDSPLVFRAGSADVLGQFHIANSVLVVELAQIDGGGEGVLPTLWLLSEHYAKARGLAQVEWIVHAVRCEKPNLKLRRILVRRGFSVEHVEGSGEVYRLLTDLVT